MAQKIVRKQIGERVFFSKIEDEKFETSKISINLITPMKKETATANALISNLFSNGCVRFPTQTALNRKLSMMYGSIVESSVRKIGDSQLLSLVGISIDDSFALNGEKLLFELSTLLCEILLNPPFKKGMFDKKNVKIEKENLKDTILAEINDKRSYAATQSVKLSIPNDPISFSNFGYVNDLKNLTPKTLTERYHSLLKESAVEIVCVGKNFNNEIENLFIETFSKIKREGDHTFSSTFVKPLSEIQNFNETKAVEQTKLVVLYNLTKPINEDSFPALSVMSTLYGGSAYSKLFMNVREKMGLCYYASAGCDKRKGVIIADCGVEKENLEKAKDEIINQFKDIQNGVFSDEELENAKKTLVNSCKSVGDSPNSVESWYLTGFLTGRNVTPEQESENIMNVSRENVVEMANLFNLRATYTLSGGADDE